MSGELAVLNAKTQEILKNGFALTAEGIYLGNKVLEQGITRKPATCAKAEITVTGTPKSSISEGDKVASDTLTYTVLKTAILDDTGTATTTVLCDVLILNL